MKHRYFIREWAKLVIGKALTDATHIRYFQQKHTGPIGMDA